MAHKHLTRIAAAPRRTRVKPGFNYLDALHARHPYIVAKQLFVAGRLTVAQAAAMAATDREFIAEFEMSYAQEEGSTAYSAAERIVRRERAPELVARIRADKAAPTMAARA